MTKFKIDPLDVSFEPLAGSSLTNLLRLLAQNKFRIGMIGIPRIIYSILLSSILSPLNLYEHLKYNKKIKQTEICKPPVFLIGHWRSGTTYLHNLISHDPNFAYPTTFQTITPAVFLRFEKLIKPIVESSLPPTRPQDNIELGADFPQEDEYGIGNLSPYSFYNGWCFPKKRDFYYKFVHMEGVSQKRINQWKEIYRYYLQKVTLYNKGKQLILKNPSNTARVKLLLEMFPDAKFIYIFRNPYHTFLSMKRNIEKEMTLYCVQTPQDVEDFEEALVNLYKIIFKKYFHDKKLIAKGNLIEIRYEELIADPYITIKNIYEKLKLKGFLGFENKLKEYIKTQSKIKTYEYKIDEKTKNKINGYFKEEIDL
jgi:hypothetical protein